MLSCWSLPSRRSQPHCRWSSAAWSDLIAEQPDPSLEAILLVGRESSLVGIATWGAELGAAQPGRPCGGRRGADAAHAGLRRRRRTRPILLRSVLVRAHRLAHHLRYQRFRPTGRHRHRPRCADLPGTNPGRHPVPYRVAAGIAAFRLPADHLCDGHRFPQAWRGASPGAGCRPWPMSMPPSRRPFQRHRHRQELPPGSQHLRHLRCRQPAVLSGQRPARAWCFRWSSRC